MFKKIRMWHRQKYWTKKMVKDAVKHKWITEDEYTEITGELYNK